MSVVQSFNSISTAQLEVFARQHRFCPTASEAVLWSALKARQLGASFRRQVFRIVRVSAELVLSDLDAAIALVRAAL